MFKKMGIILLVLSILAVTLTAEGQKEDKVVKLKLATIYSPEHPVSIGLEKLVKTCLEESDGKLVIEHFPAAQLGAEPSIHEGLRNGTIDMSVMGISEVGKRFAPVLVFDAPFIFRDADHMMKGFTSSTGEKLWSEFEAKTGIKMMAPIYYGTRLLTTNKPIPNIDALAGLKIRVPDQPNSVNAWAALGAMPTPMNLGEVYLSLQTGVVDGQENPLATIVSAKFQEVCKYINMTSHSVQSVPLFIASKSYEKLTPELQGVLDNAIAKVVSSMNDGIKEYEKSEIGRLQAEEGITVVDVDLQGFYDAIDPYIKKSEATWGAGLYEELKNL